MEKPTLRELIWNEVQPTQLTASEIPRISGKIISQVCSVDFSFHDADPLFIFHAYNSPITCDSLVDDCEKVITDFIWELGAALHSN